MKWKCNLLMIIPAVPLIAPLAKNLLAEHDCITKPSSKPSHSQSETGFQRRWGIQKVSQTTNGDQKLNKTEVMQKTQRLQMPFIANKGQTDEKVAFYAKTFGGAVFVTKDGEIIYSLPSKSSKLEVQGLEVRVRNTEANGCLPILWSESNRTSLLPSIMRLTQPLSSRNVSIPSFVKGDEIRNPQLFD